MKATFDATGEVLVVTGGANGIGAAIADGYLAAGGTAVVFDVAPARNEHPRLRHHTVDVRDRDAVFAATDAVRTEYGRIDGLVCAAAVQPRTDALDTDPRRWRETLEVNLDGTVWACQAALPSMIDARSGSILVFASGLATNGRAQASAYAASKGALIGYAKSLAAEVAEHRVRVNIVFPGVIDTPQFRAANPGEEYEHWLRTTGVGRTDDVVGPLLFLLSDAATMTGSVLSRDRVYSEG